MIKGSFGVITNNVLLAAKRTVCDCKLQRGNVTDTLPRKANLNTTKNG